MDDQKPSPEEEAPKPHGLKEELRHDLERATELVEETLEHVPAPVRWTIGKIVGLAFLCLVALVLALIASTALYLANRTEWVAQELTLVLNQTLAVRSNLVVSMRDVKGNPFGGVRVYDAKVSFRDQDAPPLLEARQMNLRYSAWGLLTRGRKALRVEMDRPILRLSRDSGGNLLLPKWDAKPGRPGKGGVDLEVVLHDAQFTSPDPQIGAKDVDLEASIGTGPTDIEIHHLAWQEGPYGTVLEKLAGTLTRGETSRLRITELRSPDLRMRAEATWGEESSRPEVKAQIDHMRWNLLARVFRNRSLDVPGEGRVWIEAQGGDGWEGRMRTRARWDDLDVVAEGPFSWKDGRLRIDPLRGRAQAGELDGRVAWSRQGWEVSGLARHADPARMGAIGLVNWPEGDLNGRFRYFVTTRGRPQSLLTMELGASTWTGWTVDSAQAEVRSPPDPPVRFRVRGVRAGGDFVLVGATRPQGWSGDFTARALPLDLWPEGRSTGLGGTLASGSGTVVAFDGGLRIQGTMAGSGTDWFGIHAGRWTLEGLEGTLLPQPDLSARARLQDASLLGVHWDSAATPFRLAGETLDLLDLVARAGDSTLALQGQVRWGPEGWQLEAPRAELKSSQFRWQVAPPLHIAGDASGVEFRHVAAQDGEARIEASGRWAVPGGSYDWTSRFEHVSLERLGLPPELAIAGKAQGVLSVRGPSGDPRWELSGVARQMRLEGHHADSVVLVIGGRASAVEVERMMMVSDSGRIEAEGVVRDMSSAWPAAPDADGVVDWVRDAAGWSFRARAHEFPAAELARGSPQADSWRGRLDGTLELAGRPSDPRIDVRASVSPLAWRGVTIDRAELQARYEDERLEVTRLNLVRRNVASDATGAMPLRLVWGRPPEVPELPMSWKLEVPNGDLGLLPLLVPQVGGASGSFELHATIGGTPRKPDLSGIARVHDGRLRLAGREEVLDHLQARLTFDESSITLDTLQARQAVRRREAGRVTGQGVVNLDGPRIRDYRFDLQLHEFTAIEPGLYVARIDGGFRITRGPKVYGEVLPLVTGNVELHQGVVFYDFANVSEAEQIAASTQRLYWTYRIHLSAKDNLFWRPENADIEFSADLDIEQTADSLQVFGDMSALRGTYFFLSNRFTIRRAEVRFDNVRGVDPSLDIEAITRLTPVMPGGEVKPPHTITALITGRPSAPEIEFRSDPNDLDEAQILAQLTYGRFGEGQRAAAIGDVTDDLVSRAISRQLSADMSKVFGGYLSDWELARESGGLFKGSGSLILRVGAPLTPNLALRYGQAVPGAERVGAGSTDLFERDVEAEYRLNRFFSITSQLTQRRSVTGSTSGVNGTPDFNVSLKARWEY